MSVSIEVEKGKPFQVGSILPEIEKTLKLILGLIYEPKVIVNSVWNAREDKGLLESTWIRPGVNEGISIMLSGGNVVAGIYSQEGVDYFAVTPEIWEATALGAATAIIIAKHSESEVRDTQSIYTLKEYLKPTEFLQAIKVDKVFNDIGEAINYFSYRLPGVAKEK